MKLNSLLLAFLPVAFLVTITGCGKDSDGGGDVAFIPDLSQTYFNRADPTATNTFFFLVDSTKKNHSTFFGNENKTGGGHFSFQGSFTNRAIQITYDTGSVKSGKSYTGTIGDSSKTITLTSASLGDLVLDKR